jgi:hypothetical protein
MANINDISGADRVLILGTREMLIYPFTAPNWTDLRIGFFISACSSSNDQTITGLTETLTTTGLPADRFWMGIKNNSNDALPTTAGTVFAGYGTQVSAPDNSASSSLTTINSNKEWYIYAVSGILYMQVWDGTTRKAFGDTLHLTVPQDASGSGTSGHGGLVLMTLTRPNGTSTTVTVTGYNLVRLSITSATLIFSDTPSIAAIRNEFRNLSAYNAVALSSQTISAVPDAVYAYWPFNNSKIRIHSVCVEKFA